MTYWQKVRALFLGVCIIMGFAHDFYNIGVYFQNKKRGTHTSAIPFFGAFWFAGAFLFFPQTRPFFWIGFLLDVTVYSLPQIIIDAIKARKHKSRFRIVVLSENSEGSVAVKDDAGNETGESVTLPGEHGLSLYVEYGQYTMLVDAGQSDLFYENAKKMGIDLSKADVAVLSHAHYDHADGFDKFFEINKKAKLYVGKDADARYYSVHEDGLKYIGPRKGIFEEYAKRLQYMDEDFKLPLSWSTILIPHTTEGLSAIGERTKLFREEGDEMVPDDFRHEQTLILESKHGPVIVSSCSHAGVANIIREVREYYCDEKKEIYAFIGGFHLHKSSDDDILTCASELKEAGIKHIYTGHCTGDHAFDILKEQLGDHVEKLHSGMEIDFFKIDD